MPDAIERQATRDDVIPLLNGAIADPPVVLKTATAANMYTSGVSGGAALLNLHYYRALICLQAYEARENLVLKRLELTYKIARWSAQWDATTPHLPNPYLDFKVPQDTDPLGLAKLRFEDITLVLQDIAHPANNLTPLLDLAVFSTASGYGY